MEPVHLLVVGQTPNIMPLSSTKNEKNIIDQILRRSKLTSTAVSIINRLLQRTIVETIDGNKTLTLEDSGKFFLLDSTSAVTITLPLLSTDLIGTTYTFVVKTANPNEYKIITGDSADGSGDFFIGYCMIGTDNPAAAAVAGSTAAGEYTHSQHDHQGHHSMPNENTRYIQHSGFGWPVQTFTAVTASGNGRMFAPAANDCLITLDSAVGPSGGGAAGTTVKLTAVTSTLWYAEVMLFSATKLCTGAGVFSDPT